MCWDGVSVCCSRSMAEHLMNLRSSQQLQSWVASMWSSSIFPHSGQIHLAVSPRHHMRLAVSPRYHRPPFFSLNLIFVPFPHGACFSVFLKSEEPLHFLILTRCRSNRASGLCVGRRFHTELRYNVWVTLTLFYQEFYICVQHQVYLWIL